MQECGSCGLCCKIMGVHELDKAPGTWCPHFRPGTGCGAYDKRPGECRTFKCEWLKSPSWGEAWKPDKAHFVMFTLEGGRVLKVAVDTAHPDVWRNEPYYSAFKKMAGRAMDQGRIIVNIGQRHIVIFADQDHDLGDIEDTDQIQSGINLTPLGYVSYARVAPGQAPS